MEPDVPPVARIGFENAADAYVRGRPDYPAEILGWLRNTMGLDSSRKAVEIGAGTGKFTKLLVETGATVIAVEPVAAMRAELEAQLPGVRAIDATAQATTLEASSCDAVLCAQAFHWFASAASLAEFRRLLRPRGRLGLVWNVRDESVDWVAEITRILAPHEGNAPRYRTGAWRDVFADGPFLAPDEVVFAYQHVGTPSRVILDRSLSVSFVAALPRKERAKVAAELESLIATHPALKGRETVAFPYRMHAFSFRVRSATDGGS
jgi:SAM-dependent methyltransferase